MFTNANVSSGQTHTVVLHKHRTAIWALPLKIGAFIVGGIGIVLALVLCCTIIGILPAIPMMWGSLGVIYAAMNRQRVVCPNCGHKHNYVRNRALNFVCRKCRTLTVVNWD